MSLALAVRLRSSFSPFSRTFQNRALLKPVPPPRGTYILSRIWAMQCSLSPLAGDIPTPESFLKAIGRGSETKISFDTWDALWKADGLALKKAGLSVHDRRCVAFYFTTAFGLMVSVWDRSILWAMERYRQNDDPSEYAHEVKPKKKIRGCVFCYSRFLILCSSSNSHGPAVQFGKRIRSRRRQ
jgi:IGR protein motif